MEKLIKSIATVERAIALDRIKYKTSKDKQLRKLYQRIGKKDWDTYKRDIDIDPFYHIKSKLYT